MIYLSLVSVSETERNISISEAKSTHPAMKFPDGNVFTGVCVPFHKAGDSV